MMKRIFVLALMLPLALSAALRYAQQPSRLTVEDCAQVFSEANACEKIRTLATDVVFGEAWCNDATQETPDTFLGYVFLKSLTHDDKTFDMVVGTTKTGAITKVQVKNVGAISEEFLAQFHGKTGQYDFAVACTADDIMYVPLKIKAMRGNTPLSESIAQGVKAIATLAPRVIKN